MADRDNVDVVRVAKSEQLQNSVKSGATACRTSSFRFQRETMLPFSGCSEDTVKMKNKPIKEGQGMGPS
jgi:hypothetical protein